MKIVQDEGAGEILLNSIDNDGLGLGYNTELFEQIPNEIKIPIIVCGGVGDYLDFEEGLINPKIDAVAAANIFHYRDQSVYLAKKHLYDEGYDVRKPDLLDIWNIEQPKSMTGTSLLMKKWSECIICDLVKYKPAEYQI